MVGPKQRKRVEAETNSLKRARDGSAFVRWYAPSPCFFHWKVEYNLGDLKFFPFSVYLICLCVPLFGCWEI